MIQTFAEQIKPQVHDLSAFKQVMESRTHPLEVLREALSNMMAPEVGANNIVIQHFSHQEYNASFALKDDGVGMKYTGDAENPGRLDRFIGLAFSKAAGLKADYWGWKGLGSKLMLNCNRLMLDTWTGERGDLVYSLQIINPRASLLGEPPLAPEYFLGSRQPSSIDIKGTKIEILGYDGGNTRYNFNEIRDYLYLNSALGITKGLDHNPSVKLKVYEQEEVLPIGFKFVTNQCDENGVKSWRTVAIETPITRSEKVMVEGKEINVEVFLKGGFTLDTGLFGLSKHRYNTGLRLSIKGIPYFQLDFYFHKGEKYSLYKDMGCFIVECDALESKLNMDRSNISNQFGNDPIVSAFRRLTRKCFDDFVDSASYQNFQINYNKVNEQSKAEAVRKRQTSLSDPEQQYVCIELNNILRPLHRFPNSEHDTLALFWKLEALEKLPFAKFISLEHTSRDGIDVIANYQIADDASLNSFVSIEFEHVFENFLVHGHNPNQTSAIICWSIRNTSVLRKINDYLYYYDVNTSSIPVFIIEKFPDIKVKNYSEIDL